MTHPLHKNFVFFIMTVALLFCTATSGQGQDKEKEKEKEKKTDTTQTKNSNKEDQKSTDKSEDESTKQESNLNEVVVTATKTEAQVFYVPRSITVITQKELSQRNEPTLIDVLDNKIGLWVEKRTTTTSDPIMRGFAGGNLLTLVDGNTLSTHWGEGGFAGDDMYGKIDSDSIGRIEIVRGPSAVLYGSNTLGGVINLITKSAPLDFQDEGWTFGNRIKSSYGSAAKEWHVRDEVFGAGKHFRFILGASYHDVNDVRRGGGGRQHPTNGREKNWDGKLEWQPSDNQMLTLTIQDVHRQPTHRFYRPTQNNQNDRQAIALTWDMDDPVDWIDHVHSQVYYQKKQDRRNFLDTGNAGVALTKTYSADLQFEKTLIDQHHFTLGFHWDLDQGESPDDEQFTILSPNGLHSKDAPDSDWMSYAVFLQDEWDITDRLILTGAIRIDHFDFETNVDEDYNPPGNFDPMIDQIHERKTAVTGGLGVTYSVMDELNLFANYSRGYRLFAPKFGFTQHGEGVYIPSPILDPITSDTVEGGFKWDSSHLSAVWSAYYSDLENFQNVIPTTYNGQDWFDFNGNAVEDDQEKTHEIVGNGKAVVYGTELEFTWKPHGMFEPVSDKWSVYGGAMWNYGTDKENKEPLRHTHPARMLLSLKWEDNESPFRPWASVSADMVRKYTRIAASRLKNDAGYKRDPQDGNSPLLRSYGLPGYTVFDAAFGFELFEEVKVSVNFDNLTDKKYRRAHSRWDEIGFNARVTIQWTKTF